MNSNPTYPLYMIRVPPTHIDEFKLLIKDIKTYKTSICSIKAKEDRFDDEGLFNDYPHEYKNSTVGYHKYRLLKIPTTTENTEILSPIFGSLKKSMWYKKEENNDVLNPDVSPCNPNHTIYIISKGRWTTNYTYNCIRRMGIEKYFVVVEEHEKQHYIDSGIPENHILSFTKDDPTDKSSIPVRNFVWNYSISHNETHHWILDDNIKDFYRWNRNKRFVVEDGHPFRHIEDYTQTKNNVVMSGMNYFVFNNDIDFTRPVVTHNTRIYSCILIKNDIDFRWRGKYNEDTDLSIRILKAGFGTMLFNSYLCGKMTTGTLGGGNEENYLDYTLEGYNIKTDHLIQQHPEIVKSGLRFNKPNHHIVNYKVFKNNPLSI